MDLFDRSYIPEPNSGCWLWEAGANKHGYGVIQHNDYCGYAHRFSYLIFNGALGDGKCVCHKCDNTFCVNPEHLWLGSSADNTADSVRKNRRGFVTKPGYQVKGEDHYDTHLTEEDVRGIRLAYMSKNWTQKALGDKYGVSRSAIYLIVKNKNWKHVI